MCVSSYYPISNYRYNNFHTSWKWIAYIGGS